ncbi:hypothetical protein, partial [Bacillus safensis]|uniref:hypothetical protein n=1 Tax=Bacillus safensis TaxID=561879 RepID=UPI0022B7A791
MESKLRIAVLYFLSLFLIVQGMTLGPENLAKYETCFTFALCLSNEKDHQKINECFNVLKPEELQSVYHIIKDHYNFKSNNFNDAEDEYCKLDDAKKPDAYAKVLNVYEAYMKEVCADESKKGACTRFTEKFGCLFGYLEQLRQEDKCQVEA